MINREIIRLKVVQLIYAFYQNEGKTIDTAEKELDFSLGKAYELYHYLLNLLVSVRRLAARRDESVRARSERVGTRLEGITPDGQFAANRFLLQLDENEQLAEYREKQKKEWDEEDAFVKKLYGQMLEDDTYQLYLTKEDFSYDADREVVRKLYKTCVCGNEDFDTLLEEHSLYWNDDKDIVDSFVLKTIKRFTSLSTPQQPLLPQFASDDDRDFAHELLSATIKGKDEARELIGQTSRNWELSRLAFMDMLIMQTAIAEMLTFPSIPVSVTINEYLDIAKVYSTPRSASYINGLLDHVVKRLREEKCILK